MAENEKRILHDLFLRDKPAKILMGLRSKKGPIYATILSKNADCTYSHTIKILNVFEKLGIVEFEKKGRIKTVNLTADGTDVVNNLDAITKKFIQLEQSLDAAAKEPAKKQNAKKKKRK